MSLSRRPFLGAMSSALFGSAAGASDSQSAGQPIGGDPAPGGDMSSDRSILHQRGPTAQVTSVNGKLRHLVMADEDYGFRATASAAANTSALQRAVNEAQTVFLPDASSPIKFDGPVHLPSGTRLIGRGSNRTPLEATGAVAFVCQAPDGAGGEFEAPWLEDFALFCAGSGIRFNSERGGFSDLKGQQALMRPRLDRLRIRRSAAGNRGSVGIEFNKCFDGLIQQCEISGFDTGYLGRGSDFIEIGGRTRIAGCNTLLEILSVYFEGFRYGGGTRVIGCDLLGATEAFVKSSAIDVLFEGNFFETGTTPLKGAALQITARDAFRFVGNRLGLPAALVAEFLAVTTRPGNLFVWEHNTNDGPAWGATTWNAGAGQPYWINRTHRSRIIQRGTSGTSGLPFPFNSTDEAAEMPWRFSPNLPGLVNGDFGAQVRCIDGSFVIPANAADASGISFRPIGAPISGLVDVWIQAKADRMGKEITIYHTDNGRFVAGARQSLTDALAWYKVFSRIKVDNLCVFALNKDLKTPGSIHLRELRVDLAA